MRRGRRIYEKHSSWKRRLRRLTHRSLFDAETSFFSRGCRAISPMFSGVRTPKRAIVKTLSVDNPVFRGRIGHVPEGVKSKRTNTALRRKGSFENPRHGGAIGKIAEPAKTQQTGLTPKNRPRINTTFSGGLAQLGERLNGIQEVDGSIPLSSTKFNKALSIEGFIIFHTLHLILCAQHP
jgi:hypothetical protein